MCVHMHENTCIPICMCTWVCGIISKCSFHRAPEFHINQSWQFLFHDEYNKSSKINCFKIMDEWCSVYLRGDYLHREGIQSAHQIKYMTVSLQIREENYNQGIGLCPKKLKCFGIFYFDAKIGSSTEISWWRIRKQLENLNCSLEPPPT